MAVYLRSCLGQHGRQTRQQFVGSSRRRRPADIIADITSFVVDLSPCGRQQTPVVVATGTGHVWSTSTSLVPTNARHPSAACPTPGRTRLHHRQTGESPVPVLVSRLQRRLLAHLYHHVTTDPTNTEKERAVYTKTHNRDNRCP